MQFLDIAIEILSFLVYRDPRPYPKSLRNLYEKAFQALGPKSKSAILLLWACEGRNSEQDRGDGGKKMHLPIICTLTDFAQMSATPCFPSFTGTMGNNKLIT